MADPVADGPAAVRRRPQAYLEAALANVVGPDAPVRAVVVEDLADGLRLLARGFDFSLGKDKVVLQQKIIGAYIIRDFVQITPDTRCDQALEHLLAADQTEAYIVDEQDTYLGQVTLPELLNTQHNSPDVNPTIGSLAKPEQITLTDMTSIFLAMKKVEDFVGESVPVVSAKDHLKLVGVIPEGSIFKAYSDAIEEVRQDEHGVH